MAFATSLTDPDRRRISTWLFVMCALILVMVALGGATRLTGSGLSMTEWKPLHVLPPLSDVEWAKEFDNYRQSPEFMKKNFWMEVDDFKEIFWLEFIHRNWGRLMGLVFFVPLAGFAVAGRLTRPLFWKLAGLFVLGGAQGVMGWVMVASGLVDRPDVSHYRLAAHLALAFLLFALILWVALGLKSPRVPVQALPPPLRTAHARTAWLLALVAVVVTSGAFVAGLDAGFRWNTWPLMEGALVPADIYGAGASSALHDLKTIQFNHRWLAALAVVLIVAHGVALRRARPPKAVRVAGTAFMHMSLLQAALGISTLLLVVPLWLGVLHQAGALILLGCGVWALHAIRTVEKEPDHE